MTDDFSKVKIQFYACLGLEIQPTIRNGKQTVVQVISSGH